MKLLFLFFLITCVSSVKFRYDNYTLFKIVPENEEQIRILQNLQKTDFSYDFWNNPVPTSIFVNILASPDKKADLEHLLSTSNIKYEIPQHNIQELLDKEVVKTYDRNNQRISWDAYYPLETIEEWMKDTWSVNMDVVTQVVGGISYEGREIKGLKISHGPGRRAIFVEGGLHAREWITPATATYMISELLYSQDPEIVAAAQEFDWHIFPVTNPDGYVWSHTDFRMWRKNRRPTTGDHIGVDLNRNWNSNFMVEGVSLNPSAQTYPGLGPFSEPETRSLSRYLISIADSLDLYLSLHSYGQLLLLPYGNTTTPLDNYYDAMNIGRRAMGALSVRYGTQYVTGNIAEAIYLATGTSVDWVKERLRVPLSYCYEARDKGTYGFLLPADQILPNAEETMDSVMELIHQAKRFGYMNSCNSVQASFIMVSLVLLKIFLL